MSYLPPLHPGTAVRTIMGIPQFGTVVAYVPRDKYTDGSYREPTNDEDPVYVEWSDRTCGWSHRVHLEAM